LGCKFSRAGCELLDIPQRIVKATESHPTFIAMQSLPLLSPKHSRVKRGFQKDLPPKSRTTAVVRRVAITAFAIVAILFLWMRQAWPHLGSQVGFSEPSDRHPSLPDFGRDRRVVVSNETVLTGRKILMRPFARRIIVSEKSRVIYCPIPKAASSGWKYLIRKFEGLDDYYDLSRAHVPGTSGLRYLTDYSAEEVDLLLKDPSFFKFVFVRDPYVRAASCYMDKFQNRDESYVQKEYQAFLAQLYDWRYARSVDVDTAVRPSFTEFVDELAKQNPVSMNDHWMSQTLVCGFGEMPFDFVGHMDSLAEDARHVLNKIGRPKEEFPSQSLIGFPPSGASGGEADEFFTIEAMAKLRIIYDVDFNSNWPRNPV
jgi:dermatan 4-sulfotransferase 1